MAASPAFSPPAGLTSRADAGMLPPRGACGLGAVGHDGQRFESAKSDLVD